MKTNYTNPFRFKQLSMLFIFLFAFTANTFAVTIAPDPRLAPPGVEYYNSRNGFPDVVDQAFYYKDPGQYTYSIIATTDSLIKMPLKDGFYEGAKIPGITTMIKYFDNIWYATNNNEYGNIGISSTMVPNSITVPNDTLNSCSYYDINRSRPYFGSNSGNGLAYYESVSWNYETPFNGLNIFDITGDNIQQMYAASNDSITNINTKLSVKDKDGNHISGIKHIGAYSDFNNTIYIFYSDGENIHAINTKDSALHDFNSFKDITGTIVDIKSSNSNNVIWIVGQKGILKYTDTNQTPDLQGTWKTYTSADGIPDAEITCLDVDNDGTMLIGTNGAGIVVIHPEIKIENFNPVFADGEYKIVGFNGSSNFFSSSDVICLVDYGDGTPLDTGWVDNQTSINFSQNSYHTYNSEGTFKISIILKNKDGAYGSTYKYITIANPANNCLASFSTSPVTGGFSAINNSSAGNAPLYIWDFGDGNTSTEVSPTHTYNNDGKYIITLKVYNEIDSCMAESKQEVDIYGTANSSIALNASFSTIQRGDTIAFINNSTGDITNYHWDFGDGFTSKTRGAAHKYKKAGIYKVKLIIYNNDTKESSSTYKMIEIKETDVERYYVSFDWMDAPKVTLPTIIPPSTGSIDFNVYFAAKVIGNADMFFWDFGDGKFLSGQGEDTVKHTYATPGVYDVTLIVKSSDIRAGVAYAKHTERVVVKIPESSIGIFDLGNFLVAKFTPVINGNTVALINRSIIPSVIPNPLIRWDFGDGTYSNATIPVHTYSKPGVYYVTLRVSGLRGTRLMDSYTVPVRISPAMADPAFRADFSYYTTGNAVEFTDNSEGNADRFSWDFGDGKGYSAVANTKYTYTKPGYYSATLRIFDSNTGKMDEVTKEIIVNTNTQSIKAEFKYFDHGNGNVQFMMDTTTNYNVFSWDFDDGYNSNEPHPLHKFSKGGYYNIALTVKRDADKAMRTINKRIFVEPFNTKGTGDIVMADFASNAGNTLNVNFEDRSYGNVSNWYWDFGDNSAPSADSMPLHTYTEGGYYNVCLTVQNNQSQNTGCKTIAVGDVTGKHSSFFSYYVDSDNNIVDFNNQSAGDIASYLWDFGDGVNSVEKQPSHTYTQVGYYAVCLTTTSATGSNKTFCQDININAADIDTCTFNCVWPGDANHDLEANHYDILTIGMNYGMQGPWRDGGSNIWKGQNSQPWANYQIDSTNNMHGDCNGDGIINLDDTLAIRNNFAFSHSPNKEEFSKAGEWTLSCEISTLGQAKGAATTRVVRSILTEPSDKAENEIYGFGYELELVGVDGLDWSGISVDFNGTFLTQTPNDLVTFFTTDQAKSTVYISLSKIDQQNVTTGGAVATIYLPFDTEDGGANIEVIITSDGGIDSDGNEVPVKGGTYIDSPDSESENISINVFPNPNSGSFNISAYTVTEEDISIEVINITGQVIYSAQEDLVQGINNIPVSLENIPQGIYTIKLKVGKTISTEKLIIK